MIQLNLFQIHLYPERIQLNLEQVDIDLELNDMYPLSVHMNLGENDMDLGINYIIQLFVPMFRISGEPDRIPKHLDGGEIESVSNSGVIFPGAGEVNGKPNWLPQ